MKITDLGNEDLAIYLIQHGANVRRQIVKLN